MSTKENVTIRVVDLIKGSYEDGLNVKLMPDNEDVYACMGHFDVMRVRLLDTSGDTVFETIARDPWNKDDHERYLRCEYPLYILHDQNDRQKEQEFWAAKYPCMLVSRVHFEGSEEEVIAKDVLTQIITDKFGSSAVAPEDNIGDLSVKMDDGFEVHCLFGQTLELGDTSVILKSCSLNACLAIVKCLLGSKEIGDIYSYCGLHRNLFGDVIEGFKDEGQVQAGLNIQLPHASMRFSVRSSKIANEFWKRMGIDKDMHFVIGTADALVDLSQITLLKLVGMLGKLYDTISIQDDEQEGQSVNVTASAAFDDVITRVGISVDTSFSKAKRPQDVIKDQKMLNEANEIIIEQVQEIVSKLQRYGFDWLVALSSQIRMLLTMQNNCVMDDLSLLIWPSAKAFVDRLQYVVNNNSGKLTGNQIDDIQWFLDGWMKLSNDIFHLESQLMQNPKLQAPRVYVPATLLAFYMAFLKKLDMLLKQIDKQAGSKKPDVSYVPLIVHDIGLRANTLCIHDPADDVAGGYQGKCALLVTIPVSLMFKPEMVIAILGHEYLHYSGEAGRLREDRLQSILSSCAGFIMNKWHLDGRSDICISFQNFDYVINRLEKEIKRRLDDRDPHAGMYIRKLTQHMTDIINDIYLDWDLQSELLIKSVGTSELQSGLVEYLRCFTPDQQYESVDTTSPFLSNLLHLYKESYADMAAVQCLGLDEAVYLENIILPEYDIREKYQSGEDMRIQLDYLCLQAALVCSVIWGKLPYSTWNGLKCGKKIACFVAQINEEVDIVSRENNEETLVYPQYEYLPLKKYLTKCAKVFEDGLKRDGHISVISSELKGMYKKASDRMSDPSNFRHDIYWYHQSVKQEIGNRM